MLFRQIERISRSKCIDELCVVTTTDASDDPLVQLCVEYNVQYYRGSMEDVLDRYYQAAKIYGAKHIIRITGDCPLADPELIDEVVRYYIDGNYDFVSNCIRPTFPDGLDVAVFKWRVLEESWREAVLPSHREHVTSYARKADGRYRIGSYEGIVDRSDMRWTVDEKEDYDFIVRVYEALYPTNPDFRLQDILSLLEARPELVGINADVQQKKAEL